MCFCLWFLCFLQYNHCFSLVSMLFKIRPMLFRWFLCFSHCNHWCFLGSYAFLRWFLCFFTIKLMLLRWYLCFSHINHCFVVGSYVLFSIKPMHFSLVPMLFKNITNGSSLVPMLLTIKKLFRWFPYIFSH